MARGTMNVSDINIFDTDGLDRSVTVLDLNGNPTEIRFTRPASTLYMKRIYSNANINGLYQTIVETYYAIDGVTVIMTATYTLTYLANGGVNTMIRRLT